MEAAPRTEASFANGPVIKPETNLIKNMDFALISGPECPPGYTMIGQISDGRTCHGVSSMSATTFADSTCTVDDDKLRQQWTPQGATDLYHFIQDQRFVSILLQPLQSYIEKYYILSLVEPIWTGEYMDGKGRWYHGDDDTEIDTSTLKDSRHETSGDWTLDPTELNPNGTTTGCLRILPSGVLDVDVDGECDAPTKQACEYKGKDETFHLHARNLAFIF